MMKAWPVEVVKKYTKVIGGVEFEIQILKSKNYTQKDTRVYVMEKGGRVKDIVFDEVEAEKLMVNIANRINSQSLLCQQIKQSL